MSEDKNDMVYDDRFGWIHIPEDGDILKAIGIDRFVGDESILYLQRRSVGILHGTTWVIPKRREEIEALRACLDDAEQRMLSETKSLSRK